MRMTPPAKPGDTHIFFLMLLSAVFSSRDTCGEPSPRGEGKGLGGPMREYFQNVEKCKKFVTGNGGFRGKC